MADAAVQCHRVHKSFGPLHVVDDVSFTLHSGEILALVGPSGCGKTTLLRLIAGFERVDFGRITIADTIVAEDNFHLAPEKRRTGMVFQDYAIFPHLTVADNVAFGLKRRRKAGDQIDAMLELVGLVGQGDKMPHELSGGQQQRVALARALAPRPAALLLDEPFSNLDANLRLQVRREVRDMLRAAGTTAIFVTHDQEEALFIGDRVALMNKGHIEQIGTPESLFHKPKTEFVAHFMGQSDFIAGQVTEHGIATPVGLLVQSVKTHAGSQVRIGIRPDDLVFDSTKKPNATIIDREFVGMDNNYTVRLSDTSIVHVRRSHTENFALNSDVHVGFVRLHALPVFLDGKNIT